MNLELLSGLGKGYWWSFSLFLFERCIEEVIVLDMVVLVFEIDDIGLGIELGFFFFEIIVIYFNILWLFWLFYGINSVDIEFDFII